MVYCLQIHYHIALPTQQRVTDVDRSTGMTGTGITFSALQSKMSNELQQEDSLYHHIIHSTRH